VEGNIVLLKAHNLRTTRQRKVILEELRKVSTHPSADEIYEMVRRRLPRISLGTVYRNLEILSDLGEIQKLEQGGSLKRFDGNPKNHYHVRCLGCNRVDDASARLMGGIDRKMQACTNYEIVGHRLEFIGYCPQCSNAVKSS
jgi:Fe2+ or Zn2+ uptake regulation protein